MRRVLAVVACVVTLGVVLACGDVSPVGQVDGDCSEIGAVKSVSGDGRWECQENKDVVVPGVHGHWVKVSN